MFIMIPMIIIIIITYITITNSNLNINPVISTDNYQVILTSLLTHSLACSSLWSITCKARPALYTCVITWLIIFNPLKTEFMLISNIFHNYDLRLMYDNARLSNVENHKHLGIHIASNNKWTKYIDSIIDSASKQIS